MAVGDIILSGGSSISPEDLATIAAEVKKLLEAGSKELSQYEEASSLSGVSSLPGIYQQGSVSKLVRVALTLLKGLDGKDGTDGVDGTDGTDGREIELQVNATHIQWRYSGESSWNNLIALSELKGDKGETGKTPVLKTVEVNNGETPSGTFTKTGGDTSGNPEYKLSLVVQKGKDGQTPVFEVGKVTTGLPSSEASVELTPNGETPEGNPKYLMNISIPKGDPGQDGTGSGNVYVDTTGLIGGKTYLFRPSGDESSSGTLVEYSLPKASSDTLGGVRVGEGLSIDPETGILSATGGGEADSVEWDNILNKPENYADWNAEEGSEKFISNKPTIPSKTSELQNDSDFATKEELSNYATTEALTQGLKGKADTTAIPAKLSQLTNDSNYLTDAPSDGNQYGRKNNEWAVIEAGGTQYLDLSMFSADSGTLSDEDYQKVVKAYEDKITNAYLHDGMTIPLSIIFNAGDGSFTILCYLLNGSSNVTSITINTLNVNEDKSYSTIGSTIGLITGNDGTKALTDNGQYAEFAKPTKMEVVSQHGAPSITKQIKPNTFYKFGEVARSLTITLAAEESGILNEYMFEFVSGSTPTTLSLPETVKWSGGNAPTIEANKTYQISIVNNYAVYAAF